MNGHKQQRKVHDAYKRALKPRLEKVRRENVREALLLSTGREKIGRGIRIEAEDYGQRFKITQRNGDVGYLNVDSMSREQARFLRNACEDDERLQRSRRRAVKKVLKVQRIENRLNKRIEKNRARLEQW